VNTCRPLFCVHLWIATGNSPLAPRLPQRPNLVALRSGRSSTLLGSNRIPLATLIMSRGKWGLRPCHIMRILSHVRDHVPTGNRWSSSRVWVPRKANHNHKSNRDSRQGHHPPLNQAHRGYSMYSPMLHGVLDRRSLCPYDGLHYVYVASWCH
jgi:hypothetical protein